MGRRREVGASGAIQIRANRRDDAPRKVPGNLVAFQEQQCSDMHTRCEVPHLPERGSASSGLAAARALDTAAATADRSAACSAPACRRGGGGWGACSL